MHNNNLLHNTVKTMYHLIQAEHVRSLSALIKALEKRDIFVVASGYDATFDSIAKIVIKGDLALAETVRDLIWDNYNCGAWCNIQEWEEDCSYSYWGNIKEEE